MIIYLSVYMCEMINKKVDKQEELLAASKGKWTKP